MKAITFKNTCIDVPGWPKDLHLTQNQGYAYALPTHYVYLCGENSPYATLSYLEQNVASSLEDWCQKHFAAKSFDSTEYDVGTAVDSVWRPGLQFPKELQSALAFNDEDLSRASQALRLLVARLDEILLFIEPDAKFLQAYGHKTRDLLVAACTEVENYFQRYMSLAGATPMSGKFFTIKDYVRLQPKLFLDEFAIDIYAHPAVGRFAPFAKWNAANHVLPWYDAYNKTKHHRDNEFAKASLINCIHAAGACLVLFSIRFGPIWWASNFINSPVPDAYRLFRQPAYSGDPRQVYVPLIDFPTGITGWSCGDHSGRAATTAEGLFGTRRPFHCEQPLVGPTFIVPSSPGAILFPARPAPLPHGTLSIADPAAASRHPFLSGCHFLFVSSRHLFHSHWVPRL